MFVALGLRQDVLFLAPLLVSGAAPVFFADVFCVFVAVFFVRLLPVGFYSSVESLIKQDEPVIVE